MYVYQINKNKNGVETADGTSLLALESRQLPTRDGKIKPNRYARSVDDEESGNRNIYLNNKKKGNRKERERGKKSEMMG